LLWENGFANHPEIHADLAYIWIPDRAYMPPSSNAIISLTIDRSASYFVLMLLTTMPMSFSRDSRMVAVGRVWQYQ
jgi:hypothetical protein